MDSTRLTPGMFLRFDYPRHNFLAVKSELQGRRIRVERIRFLKDEPLAAVTSENQPLLRRGETLIEAIDLDKAAERSFYWESMQDVSVIDASEIMQGEATVELVDTRNPEDSPERVWSGPAEACLSWARIWLLEPLGFAVRIVPKA